MDNEKPFDKGTLRIAGFDPGRKYIAWALICGNADTGFELERHGLLYPPDLGDTKSFGMSLRLWDSFFWAFVRGDLQPMAMGIERFTYRPGGTGGGSEDINLRLPAMMGHSSYLIRNTEWKSWFKRNVHKEGSEEYFGLPTPHEADAAGIALYTASVLFRPRRDIKTKV